MSVVFDTNRRTVARDENVEWKFQCGGIYSEESVAYSARVVFKDEDRYSDTLVGRCYTGDSYRVLRSRTIFSALRMDMMPSC